MFRFILGLKKVRWNLEFMESWANLKFARKAKKWSIFNWSFQHIFMVKDVRVSLVSFMTYVEDCILASGSFMFAWNPYKSCVFGQLKYRHLNSPWCPSRWSFNHKIQSTGCVGSCDKWAKKFGVLSASGLNCCWNLRKAGLDNPKLFMKHSAALAV